MDKQLDGCPENMLPLPPLVERSIKMRKFTPLSYTEEMTSHLTRRQEERQTDRLQSESNQQCQCRQHRHRRRAIKPVNTYNKCFNIQHLIDN